MAKYLKISEEERKDMAAAAEEDDVRLILCKKRKLCFQLGNTYSADMKLPDNSNSSVACGCSEDDASSGDLQEGSRSQDLENVVLENQPEGFETEISTPINGGFSILSTPTSELCGDSEEASMGSSTAKKKPWSQTVKSPQDLASPAAEKMPSAAELDEFFAAAEKSDQKRFTEKYNYDFVRDVPLEGRYQWVCLRP